ATIISLSSPRARPLTKKSAPSVTASQAVSECALLMALSQLFLIVSLIQSVKAETRANTLGVTVLPQIVPQLTTPTWVKPEGVATTRGPPLSPWQEALVVPWYMAQISVGATESLS